MKKLFILSLGIILAHMTFSQDLLWSVLTDTNQLIIGYDVMVDDDDNVYFGGSGINTAYILKYDKDGHSLFVAGDDIDAGYEAMALGPDNRVYMVGQKSIALQWDALIMAFDADGNTIYTQTHDYSNSIDRYYDVAVDQDNNIFVCGHSYNSNTEECGLLARYAPDGTPVWIQHFEESGHHISFNGLKIGNDGKIHVMGRKLLSPSSPFDLLSMVYDSDGTLLSEYSSTVGGSMEVNPNFNMLDEDGNHYIGGYVHDVDDAAFLIRLTDNNLRWLYLGASGTIFNAGKLTSNGKIICCGESSNISSDAYFAMFGSEGGLENELHYDGPYHLVDAFTDLVASGDFIYLCGISEGLGTYGDMLSLKLNMDMETMWEVRYNGFNNAHEVAASIVLDHEENVIMSGLSMGFGGYRLCGWKYSNPLNIEEHNGNTQKALSIYPNPAHQYLNIYIDEPAVPNPLLRIFNIRGEIVSEHICRCDNGYMQIDVSALRPGTYLIQAAIGKMLYSANFLKD